MVNNYVTEKNVSINAHDFCKVNFLYSQMLKIHTYKILKDNCVALLFKQMCAFNLS